MSQALTPSPIYTSHNPFISHKFHRYNYSFRSAMIKKSQLVFLPLPAMGHLVPTIQFAKLLIEHDEHLSITVLLIQAPFDPAVDSYTHSLTSSPSVFSQRLRFILLPTNHHPHANSDQPTHPAPFIDSLLENQKPSVREAVSNLKSGPDTARLAGFVVDMFCTSMIDVANEFGVPTMVFLITGAAYLGFMLHIHEIRERENVDTTSFNFKESGTEFAIPSFVNPVPASVFTDAVLDKGWDSFFFSRTNELRKVKGIAVNTFEELEPHAVQSFCNTDFKVYTVGPILSIGEDREEKRMVQGQQGSDVMEWLNDQPASSVLFLCFGSRGYFEDNDQVAEIACALERSGVHFVWSLRKPPSDPLSAPVDYSDVAEVLPGGFLERTARIGRVMGWAPQAEILAHKAVGGFLCHCGWNTILESIYFGVPIATWPLHADNQLTAFELVRELKMSVEISLDYRSEFGRVRRSGMVSAERIEKGIRQVMEKESEVRKKVKHMSEISKRALMEGGSSYSHLGRFIGDILSGV